MGLNSSKVSKSLDKKLKIAGYEVPDILAMFLMLSILSFIFSEAQYKFLITWGPVAVFAIILRIGKRGKPDNYLVHLVRFLARPKYFCSFESAASKPIQVKKLKTTKGKQI